MSARGLRHPSLQQQRRQPPPKAANVAGQEDWPIPSPERQWRGAACRCQALRNCGRRFYVPFLFNKYRDRIFEHLEMAWLYPTILKFPELELDIDFTEQVRTFDLLP